MLAKGAALLLKVLRGGRQNDAKSNETPAFIPLLDDLSLADTVVTADAAHTRHANGHWLRDHGTHYIAVVKGNHPACISNCGNCRGTTSALTTGTARPGPA
ncbi:transposase [Streptomyces sp. CRB46]|uniref:transposase n=1 Tax=Streptomyces sp. CRB46 TaxID=2682613 RepID=UPI0018F3526F|nr:transposase [Streptomyces sp. CRB46]